MITTEESYTTVAASPSSTLRLRASGEDAAAGGGGWGCGGVRVDCVRDGMLLVLLVIVLRPSVLLWTGSQ